MYLKFSDVKCSTVDEKVLQFRYFSHNTVSVEIIFEQKYYNFQTFCCSSATIFEYTSMVGKAWDISSHSLMSERVSLPLHTHTLSLIHTHTHTRTHTRTQ